mgnify:CR=1 FL=1
MIPTNYQKESDELLLWSVNQLPAQGVNFFLVATTCGTTETKR